MLNKRAYKLELLRIAEAVALEKSIDKELIINSMETGIAKAAKSKFGQDNEIKVLINRDNGDIGIFRKLVIAEKPENINTEISLQDAIIISDENKVKKIGDEYFTYILECENPKACSIVLRGASKDVLNEMERNLHDAMGVVKNIILNVLMIFKIKINQIAVKVKMENLIGWSVNNKQKESL